MSNKIFYSSPRARFWDANGKPLSNGRVSFYAAGTSTLKEIHTDISSGTPAQNPVLLDSEGYVRDQGIWLGGGRYKFKLEKAIVADPDVNEDDDFALLWTIDNIQGANALSVGELSTIVVSTIADLRSLTAGAYSLVYVSGYWTENDGGGGWFNYDPNDIEAHNGGTVISPSDDPAIGRYLRSLENWEVSAQYFGATSTALSVVGSYCQNALTWCLNNDRTLVFPADDYKFGSSQTFEGNLTIKVKENAVFTSEGLAIQIKLSPTTLVVEGKTNHLGDNVELFLTPTTPTNFRPEHWGAVGFDGDSDADFKGFINADGRYGDSILVLSGDYVVNVPSGNPTTAFDTQRMHIELGSTLSTDLEFNMGSYTFAENLNSVWTFAKDRLKSLADPVLYLDHFTVVTPISDADFTYFKDAVTDNGSRHGSLKLLTGGDYPVVGLTRTSGYSMDLFIKVGNRITAITDSQLPKLSNGYNDFNILDAEGANIDLSNNIHSIVWWGASTQSAGTAQLNGLKKALECSSLGSDSGVVYGNNERLSIIAEVLINDLNTEVRDLEISITEGLTFSSSNSDLTFTNCRLANLNFTGCINIVLDSCKLFGSTSHTITSDIIEVSRCNFVMSSSETLTLSANQELYYEGNRSVSGRFEFTTGSSTNIISNNRFNGLDRISGTSTQNLIIINGGSNSNFNDNLFKCNDESSDTQATNVILFNGSGESVVNLISKNNSCFVDSISDNSRWYLIDITGYAQNLHSALVTDNFINVHYDILEITNEVRATNKLYGTDRSHGAELTFAFKGIFPFGDFPTSVIIGDDLNVGKFNTVNIVSSGGKFDCEIEVFDLAITDIVTVQASCSKTDTL